MVSQTKRMLDEWLALENAARSLKAHLDYCKVLGLNVKYLMVQELYSEMRVQADHKCMQIELLINGARNA